MVNGFGGGAAGGADRVLLMLVFVAAVCITFHSLSFHSLGSWSDAVFWAGNVLAVSEVKSLEVPLIFAGTGGLSDIMTVGDRFPFRACALPFVMITGAGVGGD
jgi:hypothetical protein